MQNWKNGGLLSKTGYSLNGLFVAFKTEKAVRNEFMTLVLMVLLSVWRRVPLRSILCVFFICLVPMIVEMINTASETIIDMHFGPNYREDVKIAKDMLSAAVFLSLAAAYGSSLMLIFL